MAAEAHELLQFISKLASRPPSPSHSINISGAHSTNPTDLIPSVPPPTTAISQRAKTTDYRIPLKGSDTSRTGTIPRTTTGTLPRTATLPSTSRAGTLPTTSRVLPSVSRQTLPTASRVLPHQNKSISPDILKEIRTSNLILQRLLVQQGEIHIDLNRVNNLIHRQKSKYCNFCSILTIVLLLVTIGFLTYHIFF